MTLTFPQGHRVTRKLELLQLCCKVGCSNLKICVSYVKIDFKEDQHCDEYGPFEYLFFLVKLNTQKQLKLDQVAQRKHKYCIHVCILVAT